MGFRNKKTFISSFRSFQKRLTNKTFKRLFQPLRNKEYIIKLKTNYMLISTFHYCTCLWFLVLMTCKSIITAKIQRCVGVQFEDFNVFTKNTTLITNSDGMLPYRKDNPVVILFSFSLSLSLSLSFSLSLSLFLSLSFCLSRLFSKILKRLCHVVIISTDWQMTNSKISLYCTCTWMIRYKVSGIQMECVPLFKHNWISLNKLTNLFYFSLTSIRTPLD